MSDGFDLPRAITRLFSQLGNRVAPWSRTTPPVEPPRIPRVVAHAEIMSIEQLEQHARDLATEQRVAARPGEPDALLRNLDRHERLLREAYQELAADAQAGTAISPAGEWLLDNFPLITDQIREIREDLPEGYYRELPKLIQGPLAGTPRIFTVAQELILHTDARIDIEYLLRFVLAYQSVTPLTIGELWATAIMLRAGLVEHLANRATIMLENRRLREEATRWAARLVAEDEGQSPAKQVTVQALLQHYERLPEALAVELFRRLQGQDGDAGTIAQHGSPGAWLETAITDQYGSVEALLRLEHQHQAANQATVGNTVTSMRTLSAINWTEWFEQVSLVDQVLSQDPSGAYTHSTSATRDQYRHIIERLARRTGRSEIEIAWQLQREASAVAGSAADAPTAERASPGMRRLLRDPALPKAAHIGYYLYGDARTQLEQKLGYRPGPLQHIKRAVQRNPTPFYLGAIGLGTAAIVVAGRKPSPPSPLSQAGRGGARREPVPLSPLGRGGCPLGGGEGDLLLSVLMLLPASDIAQGIVNWVISQVVPPRILPRLDLRGGIPSEARTIVVVPMLLLTPASVQGQFDRLEVLSHANDDQAIHFALLSDFADAPAAEMPEDAPLLAAAVARVRELNARYGADRFFFLHRSRQWNAAQNCFMGWERKRGKLEEFNRLLVGAGDTSFVVQIGESDRLRDMRYVITLDADTQLPRDVAAALIGTLAHPLNRAEVDPATGRVVDGYSILQPRIGIDLPSSNRSRFAHIFSGNVGVDPYTTAVSDVYMDLFAEGIYAGKGIYDPIILREVLDGRFADNTLLSHDLIEGCYARAALLSNVELLDSYPATYAAYAARNHRWVRGDWQIARWLLPRVPRADGTLVHNTLPAIARYKIFDNLRRSLVPPASVALVIVGTLRNPENALRWCTIALLPVGLPVLFGMIEVARDVLHSNARRVTLAAGLQDLWLRLVHFVLNTVFRADQAALNLDAIGRALYRQVVSRQNLLEWETADQSEQRLRNSSRAVAGRLADTLIKTTPGMLWMARAGGNQLRAESALALPVIGSWLSAPAVAAWLDRPRRRTQQELTDEDRALLRKLARGYWRYFETFVVEEDHWLAPDNFQEDPAPVVAHRTSPTNIGLQMLADLAAFDFVYIGISQLTERTERVLATIDQLPRYRGHLLNWYDTRTLQPLPPAYVSAVDSGNLAGLLIALRQGYAELASRPVRDLLADPDSPSERAQAEALLADDEALLGWIDELPAHPPEALKALLAAPPSLADLARLDPEAVFGTNEVTERLRTAMAHARQTATALIERHARIESMIMDLVMAMDFRFLYDDRRHLFAIGYNVTERRRDASYYDLLASESRLGSLLAIAMRDVPQEHWFHLGRSLAVAPGMRQAALLSWSGTMFEYLMPLLVMHDYPGTLLTETYQAVVERQMRYGHEQHVPWGISESAYNARDLQMNYQYRAFGVPGLGLKRGLAGDLVVAPYATVLALLVRPYDAMVNLRRLIAAGLDGAYGLYEAVDYTADRLPPGASHVIIRSYMVHHQGMSLLAVLNHLQNNRMQERFHREPMIQATDILLQEQFPRRAPMRELPEATSEGRIAQSPSTPATREFTSPHTRRPFTHLISNGTYGVIVTNAGGGYSRCGPLAVTRWREDAVRDNWGSFCYIRDVRSDAIWATSYQPTLHEAQSYRVVYGLDKAEFHQQVAGIDTRMELTVSPEDNAEVRRITLTNTTFEPRELELTSYAELVLAPLAADAAHPAFGNLFVESEFVHGSDALLASRRPRSPGQDRPWALHVVAVRGRTTGVTQYETDRMAFVGRGRSLRHPAALNQHLGGASGAVLDPIFSLRKRVRIVAGGTAQITFTTAIAPTREQALQLADKYHDAAVVARSFDMAWTQAQVDLRHLGLQFDDVHRYQRLAASIIFAHRQHRARPEIIARNTMGQPGLWAYGISGDQPIVLLRISSGEELQLVRELLQAHAYWRLEDLTVDLVILNEQSSGYSEGVQEQILTLIRSTRASSWLDRHGGVFVLRGDQLPEEDKILLRTAARVVLSGRRGDLALQLHEGRSGRVQSDAPRQLPRLRPVTQPEQQAAEPRPEEPLLQRGVYGGFSPTGDEYVIEIGPDQQTPAPWINVVANERFGFIVSERGSGYTWSENSRENRLTPWTNDPVSDAGGEALYLRDEESGVFWSPVSYPAGSGRYQTRHGFGYSTFNHEREGIRSELTLFVPRDGSIKLQRLRLHNRSTRARRLSTTFYAEWVLGVFRERMGPFVVTEWDEASGTVLARNSYNTEFGGRIAFASLAAGGAVLGSSHTCDREEFIGRNRDLARPAAMEHVGLSGSNGAGYDPCAALQQEIELGPGEQRELIIMLGQGDDRDEALRLVEQYRDPRAAGASLDEVTGWWHELLGTVQVKTPDPQLDLLLNGYLLYQTLACRIWGRSAFYQSGGAYGFRDQLQDVMALTSAAPTLAREQILRAAQRQFVEGDVQHWWHPPTGRGIRTHFSDDFLWLPFVTGQYLTATGDPAVLDEMLPFIEGRPLKEGEDEYYDLPTVSEEQGTLYEHCVRAVEHGLRFGAHGLPLMGTGDWNDGMNLVGDEGKGESVWVGWFLLPILGQFAWLAEQRGDVERATRYWSEADRLRGALEAQAWDGAWYLRAFYDDGTPLGSAQNDECRIDSLAQSWAVISGGGDPARSRQAMAAVEEHLIDRQAGLIRLFTPPFDDSTQEPGYIKGYVPGVRENGGQYTHAAIWVIWAYTMMGDGARAGELFRMINPIRHALAAPEVYKVEPYVIAADVYGQPPHTGRGGWTWYTGSAGWMYRLGVEQILGLRREGERLWITPCIPPDWPGFEATYRHGTSSYRITVENPHGIARGTQTVELDGEPVADGAVPLQDDGKEHMVRVVMQG